MDIRYTMKTIIRTQKSHIFVMNYQKNKYRGDILYQFSINIFIVLSIKNEIFTKR